VTAPQLTQVILTHYALQTAMTQWLLHDSSQQTADSFLYFYHIAFIVAINASAGARDF
jgi:hypothetical protein